MSRVGGRVLPMFIFSLGLSLWTAASFAGTNPTSVTKDPEAVSVPSKLMKRLKSFEPSGLVYLPDLQRYLLSSDDTDSKETPMLFLMDEHGRIDKDPMVIGGLKKMTDIESISVDRDGLIYFMSSLGINKNGKNKLSRNLFIQAQRDRKKVETLQALELRPLLLEAIQNSSIPELQAISTEVEEGLDVESHLVIDGNLYIGLKNPQALFGKALLLDLGPVADLFKYGEIRNLRLWHTINFAEFSDKENTLSEMILAGEYLIVTTTSEVGDGALWRLNLTTNELTLIRTFASLKPEGLAYRPEEEDLMIVFDQGTRAGRYLLSPPPF